jgi:hypothetical protein
VFIVVVIVYFVMTQSGNFWIHSRIVITCHYMIIIDRALNDLDRHHNQLRLSFVSQECCVILPVNITNFLLYNGNFFLF